jgi:hypothetical protein
MFTYSPEAFEAHDLRFAALHEYSHYCVARHHGFEAVVRIVMNPTGGEDERYYLGSITLPKPTEARVRRQIGLAGIVGEAFDSDQTVTALELEDFLECGMLELSPTDAEMADGYEAEDIEACISLVRALWEDIVALTNAHVAANEPRGRTRVSPKSQV